MSMSGQTWYQDIDDTVRLPKGDRTRVRPCVEAAELLVQLFRAAERQWPPHRIFVLGHGQGGVVAVEAASRYEKYLGCVVAVGDCLLDEVVRDFVVPTAVEKKECSLHVGETMKFFDVEVQLESARSRNEDDDQCKQWQYALVVRRPAQPDVKHMYTVQCEHSDFGNARARGRLINAFDGEYRMRVSGYERDAITLAIETTVEAEQDPAKKSATRVFYTRGGKDTLAKPDKAAAKIDYLNRHFRFVEERLYPKRKDALGSDPDELADIRAFLVKCQVHQALKYVPPVAGRIKN